MEKINAPFTEEQVKKLNEYQRKGRFHPFTCCSPTEINECTRRLMKFDGSPESDGLLKATVDGWVCPCGKYTQDWAHKFMAEEDHSLSDNNSSNFYS